MSILLLEHYITVTTTAVSNVPTADWGILAGLLALAGLNSVGLQILKHFRKYKWANPTIMARVLLVLINGASALAAYVLSPAAHVLLIIPTVAKVGSALFALSHFWYWLGVNPLYKKFVTFLDEAALGKKASEPQSTAAIAGGNSPEQFEA